MSELKPCPHCGPDRSVCEAARHYTRWQIICGACGSSSGSCETEAKAIELWNTRADSLAITPAVQGEREAILNRLREIESQCHEEVRLASETTKGIAVGYTIIARECREAVEKRPSPAVDVISEDFAVTMKTIAAVYDERDRVMSVVREYVDATEAYDAMAKSLMYSPPKSVTERLDVAFAALRALVDGKGESKDGGAE